MFEVTGCSSVGRTPGLGPGGFACSSHAIPTIWACLVLIGNDQVRKHAETVLRETQTINARVIDFTPSFVAVRIAA